MHGRKFNLKFLDTAEAYFVCHIGRNFQISLFYASCHWVSVVRALYQAKNDAEITLTQPATSCVDLM